MSQRPDFEKILADRGHLGDGGIMTDAVLVAAIERFDGNTHYVRIYPDGEQAHHVSVGLLKTCLDYLDGMSREDDE